MSKILVPRDRDAARRRVSQIDHKSSLCYSSRKSICREHPMNQGSGSDLQPYEDGGDAPLPWG